MAMHDFDALRSPPSTPPPPVQTQEKVHEPHFLGKNARSYPYTLVESLVALYRAMRLRFGYGFESCDANGPRNGKNTNLAKHRPVFLPLLFLVASKELVLKVPKRGQFHAAIRLTI